MQEKIKSFFSQSIRVWKLLSKPSMTEFTSVAKICAIGLLIIGGFGFIIGDLIKIF